MTTAKQSRAHVRARLRDLALYIAIALVVGMMALAFARTDVSHDAFIRWGGLVLNTAALFGYFITDSRPLLRRWSFWAMTCFLLSVHMIAFSIALTHIAQWKLIWFMVMYLEVPVFVFFRDRLFSFHGKVE